MKTDLLPTQPPIGEQDEQIGGVDYAVTVKVGRAFWVVSPVGEKCQQIAGIYSSITIKIGWTQTCAEVEGVGSACICPQSIIKMRADKCKIAT